MFNTRTLQSSTLKSATDSTHSFIEVVYDTTMVVNTLQGTPSHVKKASPISFSILYQTIERK